MAYTGKPVQLINTPATPLPAGYTMYYSVTTEDTAPDASAYTTSIPTATNAGTYYVWYKVVATDRNHADSAVSHIAITIASGADNAGEMCRLYNPNSGEHFYTASADERDYLDKAGWNYEGVGWTAPAASETPVHRLYSGTDHHYTTSAVEKDWLVSQGWSYEGVGWYSDDAEGVPLYRQFNPNVDPSASSNNSGSHNYTADKDENDRLVSIGWREEWIGWYGVKTESSSDLVAATW